MRALTDRVSDVADVGWRCVDCPTRRPDGRVREVEEVDGGSGKQRLVHHGEDFL